MDDWIRENEGSHELQRIMSKLLVSVGIFKGFLLTEMVELLSGSEKRIFQENETVLSEGDSGSFMYILIQGEVDIVKKPGAGSGKVLARLASGDCFGEMALIDRHVRSASVVAVTPCILIRLNENNIDRNPVLSTKLYRNIARLLSHRLRNTNAMISLGLPEEEELRK